MPEVLLLRGGWAARYDLAADAVVGSPVELTSLWTPLDAHFASGLDAGLNYGNGKAYLFRGDRYVRVDIGTGAVETETRAIRDFWAGTAEHGFDADLDAAVNYGNGTVYLFKGGAFAVYGMALDKVERTGSIGEWGLAADGSFDTDLDAVVNYGDGHLYFFKGDAYVKYSIPAGQAVSEVRSIAAFWNGTAEAGFHTDLDGSWCTATPMPFAAPATDTTQPTPADTTQPAPQPTPTGGMSAYRQEVLRLLERYKGRVEGDGVFEEVVSAGALDAARREAGTRGATHTTCVDFQQFVFKLAATNCGLTPKTTFLAFAAEEKGRKYGGWHAGTPGMTERPQPGDVFVLYFTAPVGISHTGYVLSITPNDEGTETWVTVDGGQGQPGRYATDGVTMTQQGREEFRETRRVYHPDTNLISGEATQDANPRTVHGWVDVDTLVG